MNRWIMYHELVKPTLTLFLLKQSTNLSNNNLSALGSHFNEHLLSPNLEKYFYVCLLLRQRLSKSHIILINFIQIKKNDYW